MGLLYGAGEAEAAALAGPGAAPPSHASKPDAAALDGAYKRLLRRILSLLVPLIALNQLDRNAVAFAALTQNRDLGFSMRTYGLGTGLFYLSLCAFMVPSNLVMLRVGARRWLGFLAVGWGLVATLTCLVTNKGSFYATRLLLGAFESGAMPCIWFYLSQFLPQPRLTKPYAWLTLAILFSGAFGAPLAAAFLALDKLGGLHGWQWLYMLEGIPSIVLGGALLVLLPDKPSTASFLSEHERQLVQADMVAAQRDAPPPEAISRNVLRLLRPVVRNPLIMFISANGFALSIMAYTYILYLPIIINALLQGQAGLTHVPSAAPAGALNLKPVLMSAVPYAVAAVMAWAVAHSSQRRGEVFVHASVCLTAGGVAFMLFPTLARLAVGAGFFSLVLTASATSSSHALLVAIAARVCKGPSQVVGMPVFNAITQLGGFVGPQVVAALMVRDNGLTAVCVLNGVLIVVVALSVLLLRWLIPVWERRLADDQTLPQCTGRGASDDDSSFGADAAPPGSGDSEATLPCGRKDSGPDVRVNVAAVLPGSKDAAAMPRR